MKNKKVTPRDIQYMILREYKKQLFEALENPQAPSQQQIDPFEKVKQLAELGKKLEQSIMNSFEHLEAFMALGSKTRDDFEFERAVSEIGRIQKLTADYATIITKAHELSEKAQSEDKLLDPSQKNKNNKADYSRTGQVQEKSTALNKQSRRVDKAIGKGLKNKNLKESFYSMTNFKVILRKVDVTKPNEEQKEKEVDIEAVNAIDARAKAVRDNKDWIVISVKPINDQSLLESAKDKNGQSLKKKDHVTVTSEDGKETYDAEVLDPASDEMVLVKNLKKFSNAAVPSERIEKKELKFDKARDFANKQGYRFPMSKTESISYGVKKQNESSVEEGGPGSGQKGHTAAEDPEVAYQNKHHKFTDKEDAFKKATGMDKDQRVNFRLSQVVALLAKGRNEKNPAKRQEIERQVMTLMRTGHLEKKEVHDSPKSDIVRDFANKQGRKVIDFPMSKTESISYGVVLERQLDEQKSVKAIDVRAKSIAQLREFVKKEFPLWEIAKVIVKEGQPYSYPHPSDTENYWVKCTKCGFRTGILDADHDYHPDDDNTYCPKCHGIMKAENPDDEKARTNNKGKKSVDEYAPSAKTLAGDGNDELMETK